MEIWGYEESEKRFISLFNIFSAVGGVINFNEDEPKISLAKIAKTEKEKDLAHHLCMQVFHYCIDNSIQYINRVEDFIFPLGITDLFGIEKTTNFIQRIEDEQQNLRMPRNDYVLLRYYELQDIIRDLKVLFNKKANKELYDVYMETRLMYDINKIAFNDYDIVIPLQKKLIPTSYKTPRL